MGRTRTENPSPGALANRRRYAKAKAAKVCFGCMAGLPCGHKHVRCETCHELHLEQARDCYARRYHP